LNPNPAFLSNCPKKVDGEARVLDARRQASVNYAGMELAVGAVKICDGEAWRDDKKLQTESLSTN
jgi:hypothetical protein